MISYKERKIENRQTEEANATMLRMTMVMLWGMGMEKSVRLGE